MNEQWLGIIMAAVGAATPPIVAVWRLASRVAILEYQLNQARLPLMSECVTRMEIELRTIRERLERGSVHTA